MPGRRPRPGAELVAVELVEDHGRPDGPEGGPGAQVLVSEVPARGPRSRRRARALRVLGAALVVLVVAGVLVVDLVQAREQRLRLEAVAGLPGVLDSLAEPLTVRWRADGWLGVQVGLVGVVQGDTGGGRAVDLVTGEVLWTRPSTGETCWPVGPAGHEHLACLSAVAFSGETPGGQPVGLGVLDPATGAEVAALTVQGRYVGWEAVDGDLVLATALGDGRLQVVRWEVPSGRVVWEMTSREPAFAEGPLGLRSWSSSDSVLTVSTDAGTIAVSLASGDQVAPDGAAPGDGAQEVVLADGATVTWSTDAEAGAVLEADGTLRFRLPGPVLAPRVDDGSAPGLLVVGDLETGGLAGIDATTGEQRWSTPGVGGFALLVRDGGLLLADPGGLRLIDLTDGSATWSTPAADGWAFWHETITDGTRVLTLEDGTEGPVLVARRIADGTAVWRLDVPPDTRGLAAVGSDGVLLHTDSGLVGYG